MRGTARKLSQGFHRLLTHSHTLIWHSRWRTANLDAWFCFLKDCNLLFWATLQCDGLLGSNTCGLFGLGKSVRQWYFKTNDQWDPDYLKLALISERDSIATRSVVRFTLGLDIRYAMYVTETQPSQRIVWLWIQKKCVRAIQGVGRIIQELAESGALDLSWSHERGCFRKKVTAPTSNPAK